HRNEHSSLHSSSHGSCLLHLLHIKLQTLSVEPILISYLICVEVVDNILIGDRIIGIQHTAEVTAGDGHLGDSYIVLYGHIFYLIGKAAEKRIVHPLHNSLVSLDIGDEIDITVIHIFFHDISVTV